MRAFRLRNQMPATVGSTRIGNNIHPPAHQEGSIKAPMSIRTAFAQGFRGGSPFRKKPATNSIAAVTTNHGSQKLNDPGMKKQIGMTGDLSDEAYTSVSSERCQMLSNRDFRIGVAEKLDQGLRTKIPQP